MSRIYQDAGLPDSGCLGMTTTPSRNAGRHETCFYINREQPTSAFHADSRPHLDCAPCSRSEAVGHSSDGSLRDKGGLRTVAEPAKVQCSGAVPRHEEAKCIAQPFKY